MKDGSEVKGLVVEQHEDRVILNTEKGEVPVLREKIQNILFDDPEQSFMQMGEKYEQSEQWGEALGYYEKALQLNPNFEDAKKASVRVRNHFWSKAAAGPSNEIEKRQAMYDAWDKNVSAEENFKHQSLSSIRMLREGLGVSLGKKDDWVLLTEVVPKKDAAVAGLKKNDRLVGIDGKSLRYLNADVVRQMFLSPHYSSFTLEYERDCVLRKTGFERDLAELGMQVKLDYAGTLVQKVKRQSPADRAGLKPGDLLVSAGGTAMRYLPLKKLLSVIVAGPADSSVLSVRRSVILTRK